MPTQANENAMAHAGRSLFEMLMEQADFKYADLMELPEGEQWTKERIEKMLVAIADGSDPEPEEWAEGIAKYWELRGKLAGMSFALAVLRAGNVEKANVPAMKEELGERYDDEEEED